MRFLLCLFRAQLPPSYRSEFYPSLDGRLPEFRRAKALISFGKTRKKALMTGVSATELFFTDNNKATEVADQTKDITKPGASNQGFRLHESAFAW